MALTQIFSAGSRPTATKLNESSIPVVTSTSDITAPYSGQIVFNSTDTRLYRYTGSTWVVFSGGPVWSLTRNTAQSLPNATYTAISWNNELSDSANMHTTGVNGDRVTISQAGLYAVAAKGAVEPNATGVRGVKLTLNGADVEGAAVLVNNIGASFDTHIVMPTLYVQCALADILRVLQYQNSGGTRNTSTAAVGDYPTFTGTWLRD